MSELLVDVYRGSIVESRHYGDLAIVDRQGNCIWSVGDPERLMYARSSAKPLQALPLVESGAADFFQMSDEEIALTCASHSGEDLHVDRVAEFLQRIGVDAAYLRCGVHAPYHAVAHEKLLRRGESPSALHNNCSGKHAGMLAMAKYLGTDLEGYLDPNHPVQQNILKVVSEVCEVPTPRIHLGTDGCGVPVFALPLRKFALAFAKFGDPTGIPEPRALAMRRIATAMMNHPEYVAGTDRFCTGLMSAGSGEILGKAGAEGVYCAAVVSRGWGICTKVDDGNARAVYPAVVEALRQTRAVDHAILQQLETFRRPLLKNHQGTIVGYLEPVFRLNTH